MVSKKLLCFTGTRADYGIYRPLLFELEKASDIQLQLVVTGMHLLNEYGQTIEEIKKDAFEIVAAPQVLFKGDSTYAMAQSVGMATLYFSDVLEQSEPDGVLLLGDRGEMLAAAIAAHYQNIKVFHLHGGEKSGSADDRVRHAISKLSNYHFAASYQSKEQLARMGEEESCIFVSGSLRKHDVQWLTTLDRTVRDEWVKKYRLTSTQKKLLFVMHPDSKESVSYREQIDIVLKSLDKVKDVQILILGTNSDAGGGIFRERIESFISGHKHVTYIESIPPNEYLFLLSEMDLFIGNSSSGIIEAPFFHLRFISVGSRQQSREQGGNVINVPYDATVIEETIKDTLQQEKQKIENPYDVLDSPAEEIVKQLKRWL